MIIKYLKMCKAVYESKEDFVEVAGFTPDNLKEYRFDGNKIYFIREGKEVTIVARGTRNKETILSDINYGKSKDGRLGVELHRGFKKICDTYMSEHGTFFPNMTYNFTGHSLGAAVAAILGFYYASKDGYTVKDIVTAGQPKITDKTGCKVLSNLVADKNINYVRVVNDNDIFPTMPGFLFSQIFEGGQYRHFGDEVVMKEDGGFNLNRGISKGTSVFKAWSGLLKHPIESLTDHNIDDYIKYASKISIYHRR